MQMYPHTFSVYSIITVTYAYKVQTVFFAMTPYNCHDNYHCEIIFANVSAISTNVRLTVAVNASVKNDT